MNHDENNNAQMVGAAHSIDCIGTDKFAQSIARLCLQAHTFGSVYISVFFRDHQPCELFSNLSQSDTTNTIAPYLKYAYILDPFYDLFKDNIGDRVVFLNECAPDDFQATDYYRLFYRETGLLDECCIFVSYGASASIVISLGNRSIHFENSMKVKASLESLLPVIVSLCRRHWPKLDPTSLVGRGRLSHQLELLFELFGSSRLSAREAEIARLILKGHSSKSIARVFHNSHETVKVHRKRIYTKLNITSQGELFSIFLEALTKTPHNSTQDPLVFIDENRFEEKPII